VLVKKKIIIENKLGLHARPAALFVQLANKFASEVSVKKGKQMVNGKSIMGILMLAAGKGSKIILTVEGEDAEMAIRELENFLSKDSDMEEGK